MTPEDVRKIIAEYDYVNKEDVRKLMGEQQATFEAMRNDTREIVNQVTGLNEGMKATSLLFDQKAAASFAQMEAKVAAIEKSQEDLLAMLRSQVEESKRDMGAQAISNEETRRSARRRRRRSARSSRPAWRMPAPR